MRTAVEMFSFDPNPTKAKKCLVLFYLFTLCSGSTTLLGRKTIIFSSNLKGRLPRLGSPENGMVKRLCE